MSLHQLAAIEIGVPDVAASVDYYRDFGLADLGAGALGTADGGRQLQVSRSARRRLVAMTVGVDDVDDVARAARRLAARGLEPVGGADAVTVVEPASGVRVTLEVRPRLVQAPAPRAPSNGPGWVERVGRRAPGVLRVGPVRPRRLGHVVIGSVDMAATRDVLVDAVGFKLSDAVGDHAVFLRCSTDHHNVMLLQMPVNFLHHSSWQVDDVDEVGRGAQAMLADHPERHVWGLGRHHAGSNFFWYLKDPAGNFSEYFSDMDSIPEDEAWTPEVLEGARGLFSWGPPPPASFLAPDDLAGLMAGAHA